MSRSLRLGLFVVSALAILCVGIFLIGNQQLRFRSTYRIRTQFKTVAGLQDGADVRVGGVHEGTVKSIELPKRPDGNVTVLMDMKTETRGVLNRTSVASIDSEGLLGDKYVDVSFGQESGTPLKNGDTIESREPIDISDLIKKANDILGTAGQTVQHINATSEDLQSVTSKINEGKGTVGQLINNPSMFQRANAGAAELQEDMEALKHNFLLRGFFNKRGYEDEAELGKHRIAQLPAEEPQQQYVLDGAKLFGKGESAKLKDPKALKEAGAYLQENRFGLAVVEVSTGPFGVSDKEQKLSEARAMVIRDYLAKHYRFDDTRMKTLGIGKSEPSAYGETVKILTYAADVKAGRSYLPEFQRRASQR